MSGSLLPDWFDFKQLITGFLGWLGKTISEWRKQILFHSESWSLVISSGQEIIWSNNTLEVFDDSPALLKVTVRFFNKKSKAIGLHNLCLVFTRGGVGRRKWWCKTLLTIAPLDREESEVPVPDPFVVRPRLDVLTLPPDEWICLTIVGYTRTGHLQVITGGDGLWLTGDTTEGKRRRWRLSRKP